MAPRWTNKAIEQFLDLCIESKNSGNVKYDWDSIVVRLNASTGLNFDKKSLINYFSDCRIKFRAWHELKTKWTGIGWNSGIGCPEIDANSEKWKAFVKAYNGRPASFLKAPLPFESKMYELYGGSVATGHRAWSTNSKGLNLFHKREGVEYEEGSGDSSKDRDVEMLEKTDVSDANCSRSPVKTTTTSGKKRKSDACGSASSKKSMRQDFETCMEVLKKNIELQLQAQSAPPSSLYDRIISTLQTIPEVTAYGKDFVLQCLDLLCEPQKNGEIWLALPDNEYRLLFLKRKIKFPDDVYCPQFDDGF